MAKTVVQYVVSIFSIDSHIKFIDWSQKTCAAIVLEFEPDCREEICQIESKQREEN
jgi:hypothetical protein